MSPGRLLSRLNTMIPKATEPERSKAMIVSVSSSVFSLSQKMAAATPRLTASKGRVGSTSPTQLPTATPASPAWETVSLKNDIRRAVTKTPSNAQSGARNIATSNARCIQGSVNMMMVIGRHVNPVSLLQGIGVHHFFRVTFAADHSVERVNPRGMTIDHRQIMGDQDGRQMVSLLDSSDQIVKRLLALHVHARRRFIEEQQLRLAQQAEGDQDPL